MCPTSASTIAKRYNPIEECCNAQSNTDNDSDHFYNRELNNEISIIKSASTVLEKCNNFNSDESIKSLKNISLGNFSTLFYNIDGNKSNFDAYISQISTLGVKFSALGLAETNVGNDETASLFRIDGYNGFYNDKIDNKAKGTGVALYIDNTLNAVVNEKLNLLSPNMESIFVTISDNAKKINVGTIYRSPSGDEEKFLEDFTSLLEQLPQNTTSIILGDFNFDLFERLEPAV